VLALAVEPFARLEVADERPEGDDHAAVLPDSIEEACEQFPPLGRRRLGLPEAYEVG
jgi:hypothetical protein